MSTDLVRKLEHVQEALARLETGDQVSSAVKKDISSLRNTILSSTKQVEITEALRREINTQLGNLRKTGFVDWERLDNFSVAAGPNDEVTPVKAAQTPRLSQSVSPKTLFESFTYPSLGKPTFAVKVGTILDTFSQDAFGYEWESVPLKINEWKQQLKDCDFVFVESAWAGNDGEWLYCLTGQSAPRQSIIDLTSTAREWGIPTVFWNKEDPPHFADFLETAKLFDFVFTTDGNCVAEYKAKLGHQNVDVLPFAAQPLVHNPARPGNVKRDKNVSFGGMYFRHKFPERRKQMDYLLPAAQKFGLDIFSRHQGGDNNYQFPDEYLKNIVGSLPYEQMLTAYHAYKVFLNVNSVISSKTMCARRIFEITASGGSIVSSYSPAIAEFFGQELIPMVNNYEEAYDTIRTLLQPGGYRDKLVHQAQRVIWENHTFSHRVKSILDHVKIPVEWRQKPSVSLIVPTIRPQLIEEIFRTVGSQSYSNVELVLMQHGFETPENELRSIANKYGVENWASLSANTDKALGSILNEMVSASSGDIISKMDDDDYYGENYLLDLVNSLKFSRADIVGKAAAYIHFESNDTTILSYESWEHRYSDFVRGGTITGKSGVFKELPFSNLRTGEDSAFLKAVRESGGRIYAGDRFNYFIRRAADTSQHTWRVSDQKLFSSGPVAGYGDPSSLVRT